MLKSESLPSGFVYVEKGSSIFYHYIKSSNQPLDSPKPVGTIIITHKLEVQFFCSTTKILQSLIVFSQHYRPLQSFEFAVLFANLLVIGHLISLQALALHW